MSTAKNITGTAFIIAEFRVEENDALTPLYTDLVAHHFLNAETRKIAQEIAQDSPAAKEMVKLRTKYFDDVLLAQIAQGCQQVVILGSGLDTRAVRIKGQGVNYFEIDDPATLQFKEQCLTEHHYQANVCYLPGDYVKDDLIKLLLNSAFDFEKRTYFLWEGNTTLLQKEAVIDILKKIRDCVQNFCLSFDYMSEKVISRTTGHPDLNDYIDQYERKYAPWITGFDNIADFVESLHLKLIDNFSTAELHQKYRPNASLNSNLFQFYSVCTLENL